MKKEIKGTEEKKETEGSFRGKEVPGLTFAHLKYLAAIYELSVRTPEVFSAEIAKKLGVTKPSVTVMLSSLIKKDLVVKEKYGKVYLTEDGFCIAQRYIRKICFLKDRIPEMNLKLSEEETKKAACALAKVLPDSLLNTEEQEA